MTERPGGAMPEKLFIRRTLIVLALVALLLLAWELRAILLLVFGAVLVAVIFRALAEPIQRWTKLPDSASVGIAVLLIVGGVALISWMFGAQMSAQFRGLADTIPTLWQSLELNIGGIDVAERLREMTQDAAPSGSGIMSNLGGAVMTVGSGIADALVVLAGGIYLAMQPRLYRSGTLKLVPEDRRSLLGEAMNDSGRALGLWLKGQMISMTVIGILTGLGLYLIGVPSALALGLLAGLLEFIPLVGPIIAAVPAILIALAIDPIMALWTLGLYVVVQQVEGNVLQPVVQQYAVDLPAVILLFALLAFGALFGFVGILLAAPLTVVLYVLIKRLYVREGLHTATDVPGEDEG